MGLALTKDLISKSWKVAMADVSAEEGGRISAELGEDTLFVRTDISIYTEQAALFRRAFSWGGNRVDFFAANAGIADLGNLYAPEIDVDENGDPKPLNMKAMNVDLDAVFQGIWLFRYYHRKNVKSVGKVVITSSMGGLYTARVNPQYLAAKAGTIALGRSAGLTMKETDNISVNVICPGFVVTGLCPPHILKKFPEEHITPMSTVLKAFDTFLSDDKLSGKTVEVSRDQLYYREQVPYADESMRWLCEETSKIWAEGYE